MPRWTNIYVDNEAVVSVREHANPIVSEKDVYSKRSVIIIEKDGKYWIVRAYVIAKDDEVKVIWRREERFGSIKSAESFANYLKRMIRLRFDGLEEMREVRGYEARQPVRLNGLSIFLVDERSILNNMVLKV